MKPREEIVQNQKPMLTEQALRQNKEGKELTTCGIVKKADKVYTHKQLVKDVAETSGYSEWQIQDIIDHYVYHVARALRDQDLPVEIRKLGKMRRSMWGGHKQWSGYMKRVVQMPRLVNARFTTSHYLKYTLNHTDQEVDQNYEAEMQRIKEEVDEKWWQKHGVKPEDEEDQDGYLD